MNKPELLKIDRSEKDKTVPATVTAICLLFGAPIVIALYIVSLFVK